MALLNISIDDVSPHPNSSVLVLKKCFDIIRTFPDAKFTLFVPLAYWRTIGSNTTEKALHISRHPEFCDVMRHLPKANFEVCYHGYYHGVPHKTNNDEFNNISYDVALELFTKMLAEVSLANLHDVFQPAFRPPAWRMSPNAFRAARTAGFKTLALSSKEYARATYAGEDLEWRNVVYCTSNPPIDELALVDKTEIVYHACEWDRNYLSDSLSVSLKTFLSKNISQIEFSFIGAM